MATLDELLVKIDASTELLRREVTKGDASINRFQKNVDRKLDRVDKRFARLGRTLRTTLATFGVGLSVGATTSFIRDATRVATEIQNLSTLSGIGAEEFQRHAFAAEQFGVSQEKLADILKDVNDKMGDFIVTGQGPLADFFETVGKEAGLTAESFRELTAPEALQKYVSTLQDANVSQKEMTFFLEAIANDATLLIPLLKDNGRAFKELGDAATGVLSDEQIAKGAALNEMFRRMSKTVGVGLKGAFIDAAAGLAQFFGAADAFTEVAEIDEQIAKLEKSAAVFREQIEKGFIPAGGSGALNLETLEEEIDLLQKRREEILDQPDVDLGGGGGRAGDPFEIKDIAGPTDDAPAFVQAGPNLFPSREETDDVREQLRALEEQALRSQGNVAEAIRLAADRQIEEWERVAEETPAHADAAARAIEFINQRAAGDIKAALERADPAVDQFASRFAAAFESRGIDALLSGKISDAVRGFTRDLAELILRLTVLKPLAEGLGGIFGGGLGSLFPSVIPSRQSGGRIEAGKPFRVHEDEIIVPDVPGQVLSAAQAARMVAGGGTVVNQEFNITTAIPPQLEAAIRNIGGAAGGDMAQKVLQAQRGRF